MQIVQTLIDAEKFGVYQSLFSLHKTNTCRYFSLKQDKMYFSYDIIFDIKTTSLIRPLLGSPKGGLNIGILL